MDGRDSMQRVEDEDTARLVARFQAGDREVFAQIYSRYFDRVYRYVRLILNDPHEAEDVAQQVFAQAYQALPRYEHRRSFWVWLFIVVRNQALKALRQRGRVDLEDPGEMSRRRRVSASAAEELSALGWISDSDLLLFIERLPLPQRQVLLLRYMLDLSNPEIAAILDRSPTDISRLNHRALAFLRERLTAIGREPNRRLADSQWRRRTTRVQVIRARRFALQQRV